jgi:Ribonuclease G/E
MLNPVLLLQGLILSNALRA